MTLEFSLTDEQKAIQRLAHEFAEREIRPVAAHYDETEEFPYEAAVWLWLWLSALLAMRLSGVWLRMPSHPILRASNNPER